MVKHKRLGMPLAGTGIEHKEMPEDKIEVVTDREHPVLIQDVGNLKAMNIQHWVGKTTPVEIFLSESPTRRGFVIKNNGAYKIYVGISDDPNVLKLIGMPLESKEPFSSALFQGKLYCIADNSAGATNVDVRVWEEQL